MSPLLANLYLHEVMDVWFESEVMPRLKGRAVFIRYADDMVTTFSHEEDARRVLDVLPKPTLTIGWDGWAVDCDHVIHVLMN